MTAGVRYADSILYRSIPHPFHLAKKILGGSGARERARQPLSPSNDLVFVKHWVVGQLGDVTIKSIFSFFDRTNARQMKDSITLIHHRHHRSPNNDPVERGGDVDFFFAKGIGNTAQNIAFPRKASVGAITPK